MKALPLIGILVLCSILAVAVTATFWPRCEERFFELGLLGKDKTAEGYFPSDKSNLALGSQVNWYIYVQNHMVNVENVSVRVKLLNSTMKAPDDTKHEPSPFTPIVEFPLSLPDNDTLLIPFSWSILQTVSQDNSSVIKSLMINGQTFRVDVKDSNNSLFNMIFELWVFDPLSHEYEFGWESGEEFSSASLNMWFRLSSPAN